MPMDKYELQEYAVKRKIDRERAIDALFARLPKRKAKGSEIAELVDLISTTHNLLHMYDSAEEPPAFAGACETSHDAAMAQLASLVDPKSADND